MGEVPTWPELIVLMAFGAGQDLARETVRGAVHIRDTWPVDDDAEVEEGDRVEQHPALGRLGVVENVGRLLLRGDDRRLESADGRPRLIETPAATWWVRADGTARFEDPRLTSYAMRGGPEALVHRPQPSRWEGTDFTRPTGPVERTEFLGRHAWAVEIAPPAHKRFPLQLVVDAATGRVLSQRNDGWTSVTEWTSVEFGVELDDALFRWDGPLAPDEDDDDPEVAWQAEQAEGQRWLGARGLAGLTIPVVPELTVHERDDDTGAFHATIGHGEGSLVRRPRSDAAWELVDELRWPHTRRWSDDRWDWALGTEAPPDQAALDAFRLRLARST